MDTENNWKRLLQEVVDAGISQAEIAREIDLKPPSVNEILNSDTRKDVRWTTGNKILALHKRTMRRVARKPA
jgi:Mn-dependent DtxR family transcriptional regulator